MVFLILMEHSKMSLRGRLEKKVRKEIKIHMETFSHKLFSSDDSHDPDKQEFKAVFIEVGESLMLYLEGIFYHSKDSDLEEFSYGKIPRKIYKKEKIRESF